MTNERTATDQHERDTHDESPDGGSDRTSHDDDAARDGKRKEQSPWLREGADAPDAADIARPDRQR